MKQTFNFGILLVLCAAITGCPKPCIESDYAFQVSTKIIPDADSLKVGDTIMLISSFSINLMDEMSQKRINFSNAEISSTLGIGQLIAGQITAAGAVEDFEYHSITGNIYNATDIPSPETVQQLKYQEVGDHYEVKIAIIPKEKGVFALGIGDGVGFVKGKKCQKAAFNISLYGTAHHEYLHKQWRPDFELTDRALSKLYAFKVY